MVLLRNSPYICRVILERPVTRISSSEILERRYIEVSLLRRKLVKKIHIKRNSKRSDDESPSKIKKLIGAKHLNRFHFVSGLFAEVHFTDETHFAEAISPKGCFTEVPFC
ncbi:unnamed protein product [Rhizophagus irregularis]|nr:unnamed protein product [Rhizophagus irregularis]